MVRLLIGHHTFPRLYTASTAACSGGNPFNRYFNGQAATHQGFWQWKQGMKI
jgi:hypothetical protein